MTTGVIFTAFYLRKSHRNRRGRVARNMEQRPIDVIEVARRSKVPLGGGAGDDVIASSVELPS